VPEQFRIVGAGDDRLDVEISGSVTHLSAPSLDEMARVFNMGVGMIVVVPEAQSLKALDVARASGQRATIIGRIVEGDGTVRIV
jgi:phosphoribosylaminoimidazole (AIR) synthetase